jgi:hypothetical protein
MLEATPAAVANWIMTSSLTEILKLQALLAEQGVSLTLQTAEIVAVEPPAYQRPV